MSPAVLVIVTSILGAHSPAPATVIDMPSMEKCRTAAKAVTQEKVMTSNVVVYQATCLDRSQ